MAFFFKLILFLFAWHTHLWAIDITALYSTSCERSIGIPLDTDVANVYFLQINGQIKTIPRYQISAMAIYPMDKIPIERIGHNSERQIDYFKIFTKYENKIIPYIQGWPIQFYQDKIAFITDAGEEIVIDRSDIWNIEIEATPRKKNIQGQKNQRNRRRHRFIHPYRQYNCKDKTRGKAISLYPQEYTSDPVDIKRQLDFISEQLDVLRDYQKRQKFYAVPQIYQSLTSLGYWLPLGGRHGKSSGRKNNLTPILSNEYSKGPFSYQHIFLSGSTPLSKLIHTEAQTQFYYALKADYFRFSFFLDPNNFLVLSEQYKWQRGDFQKEGSKHFERYFLHVGLDFGPLSFGVFTNSVEHGVRRDNTFQQTRDSMVKYSVGYHNHLFNTEIILGSYSSSTEPFLENFKNLRYNLELNLWKDYAASYSLIHYTSQWKNLAKTKGLINAVYGTYRWSYKYIFKAMLGLEHFGISGGKSSASLHTGISANLVF